MKRLEDLSLPSDVKDMSVEELELLADDIREFLIQKVSATGGHLGPNLGVVELTLAPVSYTHLTLPTTERV